MKNKNKGFSLLELLVVIGIVIVLLGLLATSFSTAQKKSRDARRQSDIKAIQNSLEQYYSVCGYKYPTAVVSNVFCASPSIMILPTVPVDPGTASPYLFPTIGESMYKVCSAQEIGSSFCVTNQQ